MRIAYEWGWPLDQLRAQVAPAPSAEVFGVEFASGAEIAGDRLMLPHGLWIEGMRAALAALEK